MQKKTTIWRRRAATIEANDDLPRIDERWLHRNCVASEVYREQQKGGFRPEWSVIPALSRVIDEAHARADPNTRVVLSEVVVSFIPVTEIVFDLGEAPPAPSQPARGKGNAAKATPDAGLYRWHIYGFEKRLPKDWRFLNWDRVMLVLFALLALVALIGLLVMVVR